MANQVAAKLATLTPRTIAKVQPRPALTSYPPPPSPVQATNPHTKPPFPDPWETDAQAKSSTPLGLSHHHQPPPFAAAPQPRSQPQQVPPPEPDTLPPHTAQFSSPQPDAQKYGWYKQTFKCRWCGAQTTYQGHGNWPFTQALSDGWNKPTSKPWASRASCKECTTKYYASTAVAQDAPLPSPTLATPQPASFTPW